MCELSRQTENLAKEREALKKEKEDFYIQSGQFLRDEDEELKKKVEVEDMEEKEQRNVELEVQSYGMAERTLLDEAPISPPIYVRRTKRVMKPSYYMVSPFLSLSSIDTTPNVVRRSEEAVNFPTSPIPFHLQIDPFRMLSMDELKELENYCEANKETAAASWFKSLWVDDAWVDSVAIDKYVDFLEERQSDCAIAYPQDCKFCATYFTACLQTSMPTLKAYRDSKSASKRAKLVGKMNNVIAFVKQQGKSHAKEIRYSERVYVLVNHDNSHWFLMVLYPRQRKIVIIDSLVSNALLKYKQKIKLMTEALPILFHATGDVIVLEGKTWTAKEEKSMPKQSNGFDCGIFVMKFIDILYNYRTLEGTDMQKFTIHWRKS
ncbi:ubiquitin-like-specific protease ESD4 [Magnolia sinica]|uniref:ubiquitin-like-specific protease ESD4 n=1 Tax=Magnolia sinica TaxID=86752 RepID=UPI002658E033|nr:ubiquitin-like-specific protease ESD4 [Magnolia sinica]